jgi:hypothetical protein
VLLHFTADTTEGVVAPLTLSVGAPEQAAAAPGLVVETHDIPDGVEISTGIATFKFRRGHSFPLSDVVLDDGTSAIDPNVSGLHVVCGGKATRFTISAIDVHEQGPLRAEIHLRAVAAEPGFDPLEILGRVECVAASAAARLFVTIRNSRRAVHPGGEWTLGDRGSILLESASLVLALSHDLHDVHASIEAGSAPEPFSLPFEIYQDSSGGDRWDGAVHVNRNGVVPASFRGYRVRSGHANIERRGTRASPTITGVAGQLPVSVAVPEFWQHCPRAIVVDARLIEVGLFPRQYSDVHELQGGEQKTHLVVVAFGPDRVSEVPLVWCHEPVRLYPSPAWCCLTGAVAVLGPASADDDRYQSLVQTALDPVRGLSAKREQFDEYGWRHFGDLPADHESAFQPADQPLVSHYNNQYDAVAAFAMHFLRSGDVRWWHLMDELARHVRDIDIYHTKEDKSAYNGGLFWHTQHHMDAATSTHRTYPRGSGGGGPSAEHNYATGLMLHYFLTGDEASRAAAIGLGQWVIDMEDGRRTIFRWLASRPTGFASASGSADYHGPGRGPANSIVACLVAYRLTGDRAFGSKADELIRRCIHPADDVEARNLLDVERRWFYTVFLQALGGYLHDKSERGEIDEMYGYAQASLLHYGRWMAQHEVPYLSRPDVLTFPNETWAAQDLRKAEVFWWAAAHGSDAERSRFIERARFFFADATARLDASTSRHSTRPMVLCLGNGIRASWFESTLDDRRLWPQGTHGAVGPPLAFVSQRRQATRRALAGGVLAIAAAVLLALVVF